MTWFLNGEETTEVRVDCDERADGEQRWLRWIRLLN